MIPLLSIHPLLVQMTLGVNCIAMQSQCSLARTHGNLYCECAFRHSGGINCHTRNRACAAAATRTKRRNVVKMTQEAAGGAEARVPERRQRVAQARGTRGKPQRRTRRRDALQVRRRRPRYDGCHAKTFAGPTRAHGRRSYSMRECSACCTSLKLPGRLVSACMPLQSGGSVGQLPGAKPR